MTRTPMARGTRLRPVSPKTRTTRWPRLKALREKVLARDKNRCRWCVIWPMAWDGPLEVHHVVKRSNRGKDAMSNLITLCHACHERTDWPYAKGRLVITRLMGGKFGLRLDFARDKWEARG